MVIEWEVAMLVGDNDLVIEWKWLFSLKIVSEKCETKKKRKWKNPSQILQLIRIGIPTQRIFI